MHYCSCCLTRIQIIRNSSILLWKSKESRIDILWHVWFIRHSKQFRQLFESQSSMLPNIQCICSVVYLISSFLTKIISLILVSTQHVTCFCIYIYMFQLKKRSTTKCQYFISYYYSHTNKCNKRKTEGDQRLKSSYSWSCKHLPITCLNINNSFPKY